MKPRPSEFFQGNCVFSPDRKHRYTLWRDLDMFSTGFVQFIGLNPSTADETQDDPTIRRCKDFAVQWGYGAMVMTNLFAYRATLPEDMKAAEDPIGLENDKWIQAVAMQADLVIAAWGTHGVFQDRERKFLALAEKWDVDLHCLGLTAGGHPKHPLYLAKITKPMPFNFVEAN